MASMMGQCLSPSKAALKIMLIYKSLGGPTPASKKSRRDDASKKLASAVRGAVMNVAVRGSYNATLEMPRYDFDGELGAPTSICAVGKMIMEGKMTESQLSKKDENNAPKYGVSRSTMRRWNLADLTYPDKTRWFVEKNVRNRRSLPTSGPPSLLGAAEDALAHAVIRRKQGATPLMVPIVKSILRDTAVKLGRSIPSTGEKYDELTNVDTLYGAFLRRTKEKYDVTLAPTKGQALGKQRAVITLSVIEKNVEIVRPALRAFQEEHGPITSLEQVGNFDETFADLNKYATLGKLFLCPDDNLSNNVLTPFERSPHVTFLICVLGGRILRLMVIIKGADGISPSPKHLQLVKDKRRIGYVLHPQNKLQMNLKTLSCYFPLGSCRARTPGSPTTLSTRS
jgi:hypothetical protein